MNYTWAFDIIPKSGIKTIYEIGSRDCLDSITLQNHFQCDVTSFECNPDCIIECKKNVIGNNSILLIEKAVHDHNGIVSFYPFKRNVYDNIGASSLFEIDFTTNRVKTDPDYGRSNVQDKISVESIRLDTYIQQTNNIVPDIICMDVQEAELLVLKSNTNNGEFPTVSTTFNFFDCIYVNINCASNDELQ
jgi:FkbM family methyltransferase